MVELKALSRIGDNEITQALNYLRASHTQRGLILNVGAKSPQFKRVVWNWR